MPTVLGAGREGCLLRMWKLLWREQGGPEEHGQGSDKIHQEQRKDQEWLW